MFLQTCFHIFGASVALIKESIGLEVETATKVATSYIAISYILMHVLSASFIILASHQIKLELERQAFRDPLTGILNRRGCADFYSKLQSNLKLSNSPLATLAIDLDHFKFVNDSFGHGIGDKVIMHVVQQIANSLRDCDCLARFGGEEFIILLPETGRFEAKKIADRIQHRISTSTTELPRCTLSIGLACSNNLNQSLDELLERADSALYNAKRLGRDRIEDDGIMKEAKFYNLRINIIFSTKSIH